MLLLLKRMEDMHAEQAYLKELRAGDSQDSDNSSDENARACKEEEDQDADERITSDPTEAARHYHKILNLTKQEFKTLHRQHSKLLNKESQQENLN